jgi:hypothetical protein
VSQHRVKTYSASSGYVYQYSFQLSRRARRGLFTPGTEHVFEVSRDRKTSYLLAVFVRDDAIKAWSKAHARELSAAECYAAAKMLLFRVFDSLDDPEKEPEAPVVNAANIEELLGSLDIS